MPKAQRTRGLSSAYQSNYFRSYHKFLHKSWSIIFRISTKHQLQSFNKISAFWQNVNLKILTKLSFTISTKIELHIICISSKIMTKHHFKILPEHQLQNLDQTLKLCAPSLNKNLALRPNFTFQICNKLLSTHFSSSTCATVTTSTNLSCHLYMLHKYLRHHQAVGIIQGHQVY